ncbi:hypothetical protein ERHA55_53170 (plasmid) [Erwinia rhapontici]|nr:hypothetical protein [Erwinia rhapontici]BCQ47790.1 hypothetical protein ERHA55_53170 [Erwinia rhapontici]
MTNPSQLFRLQAGICLASFLGCIDFTIVNTALPALQRSFPWVWMQSSGR